MNKYIGLLTGAVLALTLATSAEALTVTVETGATFVVASNKGTGTGNNSRLLVTQGAAFNSITLTNQFSNLGLGTLSTNFTVPPGFSNPAKKGSYTFPASPATGLFGGLTTLPDFEVIVTDDNDPSKFVTLNVSGKMSGTTTVTSIAPPKSNGQIIYQVTNITGGGGTLTSGFFSDGVTPSLNYSFNFYGTALDLRIRSIQRPPLFSATPTAIEGEIRGVPEPGTLALLIGAGISGSLLTLRRRRK